MVIVAELDSNKEIEEFPARNHQQDWQIALASFCLGQKRESFFRSNVKEYLGKSNILVRLPEGFGIYECVLGVWRRFWLRVC
jgi:hypothetical protein